MHPRTTVARRSTPGRAQRGYRPSAQRGKSHAFTLVEVLVTVVIMAVIGLASAAVINAIMRTSEQSEEAIAQLQKLQYAMLVMEQDIRQIVPRENVTGRFVFYDNERLGFVRGGWFNPQGLFPRSELQPVAYLLRDGNLVREHFYFVDVTSASEPQTRVLIEDVESFSVRFLARSRGGGERGADPGSDRGSDFGSNRGSDQGPPPTVIPDALEITLQTKRWGEINRVFLLNGGDFNEAPRDGGSNAQP
ncbi:type II secretion system minor pseudopilin GspJ [Pseudidiomarina donghaiensis]|uniref:Type II secretion system protein J n=1 Tax=Pseudidiomarina donghaiensis TaxID=519452 RepID=A0A432XKS1_9GAMM|nr:type II secretion system minor pseudopilin GspJ [Pseudidiomarina donghaiensis]RUO49289.1 type II secretion system protein GspJ [Pseudidiomarina donghaiensis]SFV20924.1 general secretion pathway protein J [Pseudidiomarina donghaiensis]